MRDGAQSWDIKILRFETTNRPSLASSGWLEVEVEQVIIFPGTQARPGQARTDTAWLGASDRKGTERALLDLSTTSHHHLVTLNIQ